MLRTPRREAPQRPGPADRDEPRCSSDERHGWSAPPRPPGGSARDERARSPAHRACELPACCRSVQPGRTRSETPLRDLPRTRPERQTPGRRELQRAREESSDGWSPVRDANAARRVQPHWRQGRSPRRQHRWRGARASTRHESPDEPRPSSASTRAQSQGLRPLSRGGEGLRHAAKARPAKERRATPLRAYPTTAAIAHPRPAIQWPPLERPRLRGRKRHRRERPEAEPAHVGARPRRAPGPRGAPDARQVRQTVPPAQADRSGTPPTGSHRHVERQLNEPENSRRPPAAQSCQDPSPRRRWSSDRRLAPEPAGPACPGEQEPGSDAARGQWPPARRPALARSRAQPQDSRRARSALHHDRPTASRRPGAAASTPAL